MDPINELSGKVTFITGSAKNAGKTTFMNHALSRLRPSGAAFMTVGVDGERHCALTAIPKPSIEVRDGDLFVTTDRMAAASDARLEAVEVFPWNTVLGRLAAFRAKSRGVVELVGPETNEQAAQVLDCISSMVGRGASVLVDGALDRQTQVAMRDGSGFVHVARIEPHNFASACEQLKLLHALSLVKRRPGALRGAVHVCGALTGARAGALGQDARAVVLEDYTKNFLSFAAWRRFSSGRKVYFEKLYRLRFMVAVLKDVSEKELASTVGPQVMRLVLANPFVERLE